MKNKNTKIAIALLMFAAGTFLIFIFFLSYFSVVKYSRMKIEMGTFVKIEICAKHYESEKAQHALNEAFNKIEEVSGKMSVYDPKSDISRLNASNGQEITVDNSVYSLIADSKRFNKLTNGAFNISVWPLVELWKKAEKNKSMPSKESIDHALTEISDENIKLLSDEKIKIINKTQLDLSAIAKGYAVDEAAKEVRKSGFNDFVIDAGGDVYAGGKNCEGKDWRVGIKDPRNNSDVADVFLLTDMAVTTSGDYENFYEINGIKYSHIIDPVSGYPQKGIASATVVAPNARDADALSTALCVLPPNEGIRLIDSLGERYACLIIFEDPVTGARIFQSKDFKKYKSK